MPDQIPSEVASTAATLTQVTRMAERIASLETQSRTLQEDTKAIRQMFHDANNKMQILIGAEERFSAAIRAMDARFVSQEAQLAKLLSVVEGLVEIRNRADGAWWLIGKMLLVLGFVGSGMAAAGTTVWWALNHLTIKP